MSNIWRLFASIIAHKTKSIFDCQSPILVLSFSFGLSLKRTDWRWPKAPDWHLSYRNPEWTILFSLSLSLSSDNFKVVSKLTKKTFRKLSEGVKIRKARKLWQVVRKIKVLILEKKILKAFLWILVQNGECKEWH